MIRPEILCESVTLFEGDCLDVLPGLGRVDAVVTDPPYGIFAHGGTWGKKFNLQWDRQAASGINELVAMANHSIIWGGNYFTLPPSRGWLVWYKRDSVPTTADCELAWTSMDANTRLIDWTIAATNAERNGHPTLKPLEVMRWSIRQLPDDVETILDPFAGSGTTAIAAMLEGRKCILIEREPKYCEIIRRRVAEANGVGPGSLFKDAPRQLSFAEGHDGR